MRQVFKVYAVWRDAGMPERRFLNEFSTQDEALRLAECAVGGTAQYAFVRGPAGCVVAVLRPPTYDPQPLNREGLARLAEYYSQQPRDK